MRKTVFHVSSWFDVSSSGSKGGFVNADKTKVRFYSGKWRDSACSSDFSSREGIDVLYVTPSSDDPPLGFIDR